MKIQIMSDIHTEFFPKSNWDEATKLFFRDCYTDCDVLVIAGDLSNYANLRNSLRIVCEVYNKQEVLYIPGNHEYYGIPDVANKERVIKELCIELNYSNLYYCNRNLYVEIDEFISATLWFKDDLLNLSYIGQINDCRLIPKLIPWVYHENIMDIEFIKNHINENSLVFTHYLPTIHSVLPEFKGDNLNRFFVCDLTNLIEEVQPRLWIHAHTHGSLDYNIGKTRIICNPFGYFNVGENRGFNPHLIVVV